MRYSWMLDENRLPREVKNIFTSWEVNAMGRATWDYNVAYENITYHYKVDVMLRKVLGNREALEAAGIPEDVLEELDRLHDLAMAEQAAMDEETWEDRSEIAYP